MEKNNDMLHYEKEYQAKGYRFIAGTDEAGRGPLAGPVVVASVIMPLDDVIEGVNDSKQVSEKKREILYEKIIEKAIAYKIEEISVEIIEEINILNATKLGMRKSIEGLEVKPDFVIIDAVEPGTKAEHLSLIKGDALSYSVAAASILAKVYRDRLMRELDKQYPNYNFAKHKGYGTKEHIEAIKKYGACEIHRMSFIRKFLV